MTTVFISHSSKDRPFIEQEIISPLKRHSVDTWYSRDDIRATADWEQSIKQALSNCEWFLVALSPDSVISEWVRAETHWAVEHRIGHIIPVLVRECDPNDLHLRLNRIQYIDFSHDLKRAQQQLFRALSIDYEYRRSMHELRLIHGPNELRGAIYPIRSKVIIGRSVAQESEPNSNIIQVDDPTLAQRHAEFVIEDKNRVRVTDLKSSNGILVNRQRITSVVLNDGDTIFIGSSLFLYRQFANMTEQ